MGFAPVSREVLTFPKLARVPYARLSRNDIVVAEVVVRSGTKNLLPFASVVQPSPESRRSMFLARTEPRTTIMQRAVAGPARAPPSQLIDFECRTCKRCRRCQHVDMSPCSLTITPSLGDCEVFAQPRPHKQTETTIRGQHDPPNQSIQVR